MISIDPPEGWMYGFPKLYNKAKDPPVMEWLVLNGYPQAEIDKYGDDFYCRTIG